MVFLWKFYSVWYVQDSDAQTEPPPLIRFGENVSQWEIFDYYKSEADRAKQTENANKTTSVLENKVEDEIVLRRKVRDNLDRTSTSAQNELANMTNILRKMERIVNQNAYEDIALDFKYWEDKSDLVKDTEGSLLPLWEFRYDKTSNMPVTCIAWHSVYHDFFVVGHGPSKCVGYWVIYNQFKIISDL